MVELAIPGVEPHTLGIYIDHNMGGLVKDVFLAGPLASVRKQFASPGADRQLLQLRELDLADARARRRWAQPPGRAGPRNPLLCPAVRPRRRERSGITPRVAQLAR
jgi:hypothetical protein